MAKSFKRRITRVISTTLQSCRSKDPSTLPEDPVPAFPRISPANPKFTSINFQASKDQTGHRSSFMPADEESTQEFKWKEEAKWHVVAKIYEEKTPRRKIYNSSASGGSDDDSDFTFAAPRKGAPPSAAEKKKRRGKKKKKNIPSRLRISTSSADSGWFSSDGGFPSAAGDGDERDEEETETLVSSSISFSTDSSSEFNNTRLHPIEETPFPEKPHRRNKRRVSRRIPLPSAADGEIPARLSMFKKLIPCSVDGKVKESFAIVKRSKDPYEDFKNSMVEMILEKQMFEEKDLEQLLQCFLSLNSNQYHAIIIRAFSEIWEAIFCAGKMPSAAHRRRVTGGGN